MFAHTDIPEAPWYVVDTDDKRRARLNCIAHLLSKVPYVARELPAIEVLKWKEIFDALEEAIDECEDVSNALESIAVKNS